MLTPRTAYLLTVALAVPFAATQAQTPAPGVQVSRTWSRATPPGASTAAVYATLDSPAGDTLTGVSSAASGTASVHEMAMDGTIMRMRELLSGLALPAGQPVTLKPGGFHIMLEGLKAPLRQGQTVPLHLTFAKSAPVDVTATVASIGATEPAADAGPGTKRP